MIMYCFSTPKDFRARLRVCECGRNDVTFACAFSTMLVQHGVLLEFALMYSEKKM